MNPFSLEGKRILITGASSGIGQQCAISCSEMGATVAIVGRSVERLEETKAKLKGAGHEALVIDLLSEESINSKIEESITAHGKFDGFIHSAGVEYTRPLKLHKRSMFDEMYHTNTVSAFEVIKVLTKKKNIVPEGMSFVFISSIRGILGQGGQVGYCASKGAIYAAVKALAVEFASANIRVNAILPGQVKDTKMTETMMSELPEESVQKNLDAHLLGWVPPKDIANGCIYLLSDASKTVTGTNLLIDSGYSAR